MKKFFLLLCMFYSFGFAHKEPTHQYIVREGYKLLKSQLGYQICTMDTYIGTTEGRDANGPWGTAYVVGGAYNEDRQDPVFGHGKPVDPFGIWNLTMVSITHFWRIEDAELHNYDEHTTVLTPEPLTITAENAWKKMRAYRDGGWEVYVFDGGCACGTVYKYFGLIDFFKTGRMFKVKTVTTDGRESYINEWVTVSEGFKRLFVFNILGRMAHLLGDMSIPAHSHDDEHGTWNDRYEAMMNVEGDNAAFATYWNAENTLALKGGFVDPYSTIDEPLHYLMYSTNQLADFFPSNRVSGNNIFYNIGELGQTLQNLGQPKTNSEYWDYQSPNFGTLVSNIRDVTFPYAIRATAGLFYWFARESGLLDATNSPFVQVKVQASSNIPFTVDDTTYTSPQTFNWLKGSNHTLNTISLVEADQYTRHVFINWSDGGAISHSIIAPQCPATYTANFRTQFYLTGDLPAGMAIGQGWYDEGSTAYVTLNSDIIPINSSKRKLFANWTGDANGTTYTQSSAIVMNAPKTVGANWKSQFQLTVNSANVSAGTTNPVCQCWVDSSSSAGISANPYTGCAFNNWTGTISGTNSSTSVTMNAPNTALANFIPAPPVLLLPSNNNTNVSANPTLTWNQIRDGGTYTVAWSTDSTFQVAQFANTSSDTSYNLSLLLPLTKYYWKVRGGNAMGNSNWSPLNSFTTNNGLIASFSFEGNFNDQSTYANNGTGQVVTFAPGKIGQGLSFNNTYGAYVCYPDQPIYHTQALSVEAWINPTLGYGTILCEDISGGPSVSNNGYGFSLELFWYSVQFKIGTGQYGTKVVQSYTPQYQWSHVVGTYDGSYMKLYINGQLMQSYFSGSEINYTGYPLWGPNPPALYIGNQHNTTLSGPTDPNGFNGNWPIPLWCYIDEVKIYNRPLTATEVQQHYNGVFGKIANNDTTIAASKMIFNELPKDYALGQNYPNPFNPSTKISFELPKESYVNLTVYDILGKVVTQLVDETRPAGRHQVNFDASRLPSGMYIYRIRANEFTTVRKMLLAK